MTFSLGKKTVRRSFFVVICKKYVDNNGTVYKKLTKVKILLVRISIVC